MRRIRKSRYSGLIPKEQRKLVAVFLTEKEYVDWLLFLKRENLTGQEFIRGAICGVVERKEKITDFIMDLKKELHNWSGGTPKKQWETEKAERLKTIEDFGLNEEEKENIYDQIEGMTEELDEE